MKRFIALLLLAVTLTFSLGSCNKPEYKWKYVTELPTYVDEPKYLVIYHNINDIQQVGEYKVYVKGYGSAAVTSKNCLFECIGTLTVWKLEKGWSYNLLYLDNHANTRSRGIDPDEWEKQTRNN